MHTFLAGCALELHQPISKNGQFPELGGAVHTFFSDRVKIGRPPKSPKKPKIAPNPDWPPKNGQKRGRRRLGKSGNFFAGRNTEFFMSEAKNPALPKNREKAKKWHQPHSDTFWPKEGPKKGQKGPKPRASIDLIKTKRPPQSDPPFLGPKWPQNFPPKKGAAFWGCRGVNFPGSRKKSPRVKKTQTPDFWRAIFEDPQNFWPKTMAP